MLNLLLLFATPVFLMVVLILPNLASVVSVPESVVVNDEVVILTGILELLVISCVNVLKNSVLLVELYV